MTRRFWVAAALALALLCCSCSRPLVADYAFGEGSVDGIEYWEIRFVPQMRAGHWEVSESYFGQPSFLEENMCIAYVNDVRDYLTQRHGLHFADNVPSCGMISIGIVPSRMPRLQLWREDLDPEADTEAVPMTGIRYDRVNLPGHDWVSQVLVQITDPGGKVACDILVRSRGGDGVPKKHVAKAIARALAMHQ